MRASVSLNILSRDLTYTCSAYIQYLSRQGIVVALPQVTRLGDYAFIPSYKWCEVGARHWVLCTPLLAPPVNMLSLSADLLESPCVMLKTQIYQDSVQFEDLDDCYFRLGPGDIRTFVGHHRNYVLVAGSETPYSFMAVPSTHVDLTRSTHIPRLCLGELLRLNPQKGGGLRYIMRDVGKFYGQLVALSADNPNMVEWLPGTPPCDPNSYICTLGTLLRECAQIATDRQLATHLSPTIS